MGRIRGDYESPLIRKMTAEIVELYGIDEAVLYRPSAADNITNKDPLYSEPTTTPSYKKYSIRANRVDPDQDANGDAEGTDFVNTATLFVALNHLLGAGVVQDRKGDYISAGDTIGVYSRDGYIEYDITKAKKDGWVNDSIAFSGYILTCVRKDKFTPERKTHP